MRGLAISAAAVVSFVATSARAHELRPAVLSLAEQAPGRFLFRFTAPTTARGRAVDLNPEFPAHCAVEGPALDCGTIGLVGNIEFPGIEISNQRVVVQIEFLGGSRLLRTIDREAPALFVRGAPDSASTQALLWIAKDYTKLGIEHILTGVDHLLFVLGLVLLVGFHRRLIATITAFTAAHSLTLGAAALGFVSVPAAPVEATIALSILLVAVECANRAAARSKTHEQMAQTQPSMPTPLLSPPTSSTPLLSPPTSSTPLLSPPTSSGSLTLRAPWTVAFGFGLLHGLGFAGALTNIGLPPHQTVLALTFFNSGVELGQLTAIGAAWGVMAFVQKYFPRAVRLEWAVIYAMGGLAAYFWIERALAIVRV